MTFVTEDINEFHTMVKLAIMTGLTFEATCVQGEYKITYTGGF